MPGSFDDQFGGYSTNVRRGVLPGFQTFTPPDSFFAPYYQNQSQQNTNATQERISNRALDSRQDTLKSFLPSLMSVIGGFGSGGGGYQTDYGAGIQAPQRQQQTFRAYAQPQMQQQGMGMGGGGMGGNLSQLLAVLNQFRG